jgi:hypothetical protein
MVGMFETDTQIYSLTERYLFIPTGGSDVNWLTHPQTRVNFKLLNFPLEKVYFDSLLLVESNFDMAN